jgi:arabinogalactan endo-1,4-beta-galactosidase
MIRACSIPTRKVENASPDRISVKLHRKKRMNLPSYTRMSGKIIKINVDFEVINSLETR